MSLSRLLHRDSSGKFPQLGRNESVPDQALLAGAAMKPDEGARAMNTSLPTYKFSARRKSEIHDALTAEQAEGLKEMNTQARKLIAQN